MKATMKKKFADMDDMKRKKKMKGMPAMPPKAMAKGALGIGCK